MTLGYPIQVVWFWLKDKVNVRVRVKVNTNVRSITQNRIIPKCSNLVPYIDSDVVLKFAVR